MKKITLLVITVVILALAATAYGATRHGNGEDDFTDEEEYLYADIYGYQQVTPDDQIVEGNATALETIKTFLNVQNINVGNDYAISCNMESHPVYDPATKAKERFMLYTVEDYDSDLNFLYLFKDDTAIVESSNVDDEFILSERTINSNNSAYRNEENSNQGAFAWTHANSSYALMSADAGFRCTSIWGYDSSTETVTLVWCDCFNCPIWKSYL